MALIRWEPAREMASLQQEINRLFGAAFDPQGQGAVSAARQWMPPMDLVETDSEYVLRADLPGMSEEDISIEMEDDLLVVSGERKAEHEDRGEGYFRLERASGKFMRSLTLPEGVNAEAIQANFDRGVLEVRVPKPEQRKPQRVEIAVGNQPKTIEAEAPAGEASLEPDREHATA